MRLYPEKLDAYLQRQLAPAFVVSGDEPLLLQECCDTIRATARQRGFTERTVWHVATGFDWGEWLQRSLTGSLFAPRQLIELRLASGKLNEEASAALREYAAHPGADNVLLVSVAGRLDRDALNSRWYQQLDQAGVTIAVQPLNRERLPGWVGRRMQQRGLRPTAAAIDMLVERTEGNPLACAQEIDKLVLLCPNGQVNEQTVAESVTDSARFNVFAFVDAALEGDAQRVARILERLREEGSEPLAVLWVLVREIRSLAQLEAVLARGQSFDAACAALHVWDNRKPLLRKSLGRLRSGSLGDLLQRTLVIDRTVKGDVQGNAWDELLELALTLAGRPLLPAGGAGQVPYTYI